mgnify:CR=1 FL=1
MLQIDSIVKISRPSIELSGVLKKDKLIIGGYGITNYFYNPLGVIIWEKKERI